MPDYLLRDAWGHALGYQSSGERFILVSPDDGGVRMREDMMKNMKPEWVEGQAAVHQLRVRGSLDEKEILDFVGEVEGKIGIIVDDMMRSGTTMFQAAKVAKNNGAKKVIGLCTHFYGFDSQTQGTFDDRLASSALDELVVTNTRGDVVERVRASHALASRLTVLDVSPYLAKAMANFQSGGTVKDMITRVPDLREFYRVVHRAGDVAP